VTENLLLRRQNLSKIKKTARKKSHHDAPRVVAKTREAKVLTPPSQKR